MTLKIEPGKQYRLSDGSLYQCYKHYGDYAHGAIFNGTKWLPITHNRNGRCLSFVDCGMDIIAEYDWRSEIPWDVLRDDIEWVAMDVSGAWFAYCAEPEILGCGAWRPHGIYYAMTTIKMPSPPCDWTETKTRRPR